MNEVDHQVVITTKSIISGHAPILCVLHDDDGIWQCHSDAEELNTDDALVISFRQMAEHDHSVEVLRSMQPGFQAYRKNADDAWKIVKIMDE